MFPDLAELASLFLSPISALSGANWRSWTGSGLRDGSSNWSGELTMSGSANREIQPESLLEAVCHAVYLVDPCRMVQARWQISTFFLSLGLGEICCPEDDRRKRSRSTVWWLMIFDHQSFTTNRRLICWLGGYDACVTLATSCNAHMKIQPP